MPSLTKVQSGFMEAQGALPLSSGTAAAPGLKFDDHAGTGMFSPSTGVIGFSTSSHSQALTLDTNGRLLVGPPVSVPIMSSSTGSAVQVNSNSHNTYAQSWYHGSDSTAGPVISLAKSRNTTYGSYTTVDDDDNLGTIYFAGDDGSDINQAGASINAQVDGTPGSSNMPGRLIFSTTESGDALPTERVRITSAGHVNFNGGTVGITTVGDVTMRDLTVRTVTSSDQVISNRSGTSVCFRAQSSGTDKFVVQADGKVVVGGGTTTVGTLTLAGDGKDITFGRTQNSGTGGVGRLVATGNIVYIQAGANASSGSAADLVFSAYGGVGERARITSTGKLEAYKGTSTTGKTSGSEAFTVGNGAGNHRFAVYPDGSTVIGGTGDIGNNNIQLQNDGMIFAGAAHFTKNLTPTSGRGIEIFEAATGVGQISSYNRSGSSWDELRIKSDHLELFTGSSNKLSARFNTNGSLTLFVNSASHQTHLFTTGGGNAGKALLYDANGTVDVQLATDTDSWFQGGNVAVGHNSPDCIFHVRKDSSDTSFTNENTPSTESGVKIANLNGGVGTWTALTLSVSNGSATQNGSIVAKSVSGGTTPEIHIGQRSGNTTDARISINSSGYVGISNTAPTRHLSVSGNMNLSSGSRIESYSSGGNLIIQGGSTYPGGHLKMYGGTGGDKIEFCTSGGASSSIIRMTLNSNGSIRLTPEGSTSNPNARIDTSGDYVRFSNLKDGSGGSGFILQTQHNGSVRDTIKAEQAGVVKIPRAIATGNFGNAPQYNHTNYGYMGDFWPYGCNAVYYLAQTATNDSGYSSHMFSWYDSGHWSHYGKFILFCQEVGYIGGFCARFLSGTSVSTIHGWGQQGSASTTQTQTGSGTHGGQNVHRYDCTVHHSGTYRTMRWYLGVANGMAQGVTGANKTQAQCDARANSYGSMLHLFGVSDSNLSMAPNYFTF